MLKTDVVMDCRRDKGEVRTFHFVWQGGNLLPNYCEDADMSEACKQCLERAVARFAAENGLVSGNEVEERKP